jgi:hypothetical protein
LNIRLSDKKIFLLFIPVLIFFIFFVFLKKPEAVEIPEPEPPVPTQAEIIMRALSAAYPDKIGPAEFRDDDWAFLLGEKWFYYAEGRILPEEHRHNAQDYGLMRFYQNYVAGMPLEAPLPAQPSWTRNMTERGSGSGGGRVRQGRPQFFYESLWGFNSRDGAAAKMKEVDFLGRKVKVHADIVKDLNLVEKRILSAAETVPAVKTWIASLGLVDTWNWRNVASSVNRSLHSYGIAIDLLPENLGGLATYWQWTARHTPEWWTVPYSKRYHPPDEVILAFESAGFIWGGKWPFFDTMHFEYHPEVFVLNGIELTR